MTPPRSKPRWTAEKRAAKGKAPQRNRRFDGAAEGPQNRKQRRAIEFADKRKQFENGGEQRPESTSAERTQTRDGDRGGYGRRDDNRGGYGRRDDNRRGYGRRDDRDNRGGYERRDDNRGYGRRDDRDNRGGYERRDDNRGGYGRRDDNRGYGRRDDDRGYGRRDDRDNRGGYERRDDNRGDRGGYERRDDDRSRSFDRDRPKFRSGSARFDSRRALEPRGREDRRPRFDRSDRDQRDDSSFEAEGDQMSWTATTAEQVEGEVTSGFFELGVAEPLVRVLAGQGITAPFPIQAATIGDALAGKDVLGRGRTGSGKTLAFGLPMLTRLSKGDPVGSPRAVILTPTRELALQIADNLSPLAAVVGIDLTLIAGGMSYGPQIRAFERGVDVVVATPGRLIDLIEQGAADLSKVEVLILDEADHMADLGFLPDVETVLDAAGEGQRLLFSATLDNAVGRLVKKYLNDPVTHEVDSEKASVTTMVHAPLLVKPHHKNEVTAEIANREGRTVLFARTQMGTDRIAAQLREAGVMAGALHGGLTQGARARILAAFKDGHVPVLVATDVAARGIHVDDVTLVLQVDPPHDHKDYLHRAGRTARAGNEGVVASIVLPHQRRMENRILTGAGVRADFLPVEPGSDELREATGARPVSGEAIPDAEYQALIAPKQQPRRRPEGGRGGNRGGGYRPRRRY